MTLVRLREQRAASDTETRGLAGAIPGGGGSYASLDPRAIPPHGYDHLRSAGVNVTPHSLLCVDVVYTALRIISNNVIKMGNLRAYTEGFSEGYVIRNWAENQPAILTNTFGGGTLGGQAGTMMQCTGMDRTIWSMALFNEAFWYVLARDRMEKPQTIEVLHPAFMEVKSENGVVKYIYGSGSNRKELPIWNVIHVPMKSLPAARRALSPTDYAGVAGALAIAAYEFGSSWFSQGQAPSFIFHTDQKLGTEEVERIADKYMIRHAGLENAHRPVVFDSGIKADKVMTSPDEAQYLQTLEYARQVLGSWFGIPQSKLPNALQKQPAAPPHTREEEAIAFQQDCLSGYTVPLEEVHSALIDASQWDGAAFNEDLLRRPDSQFLAQLIQAMRMSQVDTIDELRAQYLGKGPLPNGQGKLASMPFASNVAPDSPSQTGSQSPKPPGPFPEMGK